MAYVKVVPFEEAQGELRDIYERGTGGSSGYARFRRPGQPRAASNIISISSLRPHLIPSFFNHFNNVMFSSSGLSRIEREMIATVVSTASKCQY